MWKILGALLCSFALAIAAESCKISIPEDFGDLSPIILSKGPGKTATYELLRSNKKVTTIDEGSSLRLTCNGDRIEMYSSDKEKPFASNTLVDIDSSGIEKPFDRSTKANTGSTEKHVTLVLTCKGGSFVDKNAVVRPLKTIVCSDTPPPVLHLTTTPCYNNKGVIYESGVEVYNKFYKIFEICYDKQSATTFYTHNTLHGATIKYKIPKSPKRPEDPKKSGPFFNADGMVYNSVEVNDMYSLPNQKKVFAELFGTEQTYINDKNSFLSRGHLTAAGDFMFGYEILSSYWYTNAAPQYQAINGGGWQRVEEIARELATAYGDDIEAYNGYLKMAEFRHKDKMVNVYLDDGKKIYIPKYYFKILWHERTKSAIVFVTANNPFNAIEDKDVFCKNVCEDAKLNTGQNKKMFATVASGYTFCCELEDFQKEYKVLDDKFKAQQLLKKVVQDNASKKKKNVSTNN